MSEQETTGILASEAEVVSNDLSYPTASDLQSEIPEIDADGDDAQPETDADHAMMADVDHEVETKTAQEMLNELMENDGEESEEGKQEAPTDEDESPENKLVLKHGEELQNFDLNKEEDKASLTELAQKGLDYTKKTQSLAEERKGWESEVTDTRTLLEGEVKALEEDRTKFNEQLNQYNIIDHALAEMQKKDPEVFEAVTEYVREVQAQQETPWVKSMQAKMNDMERRLAERDKQYATSLDSEKNSQIASSFKQELGSFKEEMSSTIAKLGLKPDWDKVQDAWVKGEKADMSVKDAFYATHGDAIARLYDSKNKVAQAQLKSVKRTPNAAKTRKGSLGLPEKDWSKMGFDQMAREIELSL